MKNVLLQAAMKLNKAYRRKKWWRMTVRTLAIMVVFCTTYVLILPALTMQSDTVCGLEEHIHAEECYILQPVMELGCTAPVQEAPADATEPAEVPADATEPAEVPADATEPAEVPADAAEPSETPADTTEPSEAPADATEPSEVPADATESAAEPAEASAHTHETGCYDEENVLICSLPEITEHIHTESCMVPTGETERVLVCQLQEHIHEDACYPLPEETQTVFICGLGEHTHVDSCHDEAGTLICSIPEHSHEAACIQEVDPTADVETLDQWQSALDAVELTGEYPADILAVAQTQLDYAESQDNVVLTSDGLKGYNRYSAMYGDGYGDWSLLFVKYVLDSAEVKDFPVEADTAGWIAALEAAGRFGAADAYSPKVGDVVFLGDDRAGFVAELIPTAEDVPDQMKVIEGDVSDKVAYVTYLAADPVITGYGIVPESDTIEMIHQGADYTVTATFPRGINIPESAQLSVQEILPGTEEYNTYYQQSVEVLMAQSGTETEEELAVSFARFFDITFLVNGEKIEPTAAVDIKIQYAESFTVEDGNAGMVVHFAEDGTEVLDAETNSGEAGEADTFEFTQGSFSVSGTLVATRAALANAANRIRPSQIDTSGSTLYVLYTQIGNSYYALDGNGYAVPITVTNNTVTLSDDATNDLFWSFGSGYIIGNLGTSRYVHPYNNGGGNTGTTTANPYDTALDVINNGYSFRIRGANNNYLRFANATSLSVATQNSSQASAFYIAEVGRYYNVWFDGTNGGMMSYYGAADTNIPVVVTSGTSATVALPETWQSSTKYPYKLQGWYDINSHTYYPVNPNDDVTPTVTLSGSTVFYADWIAATYNVGIEDEHTVDSLDTNNFITTHVFDYNALFNVLSLQHTGSITAAGHTETWTIVNNGTVPYNDQRSLGFVFVDYDSNGEFSYANGRDNTNINQGDAITAGILQEVRNASGQDLLKLLFDPDTDVIGKYYAGEGNYLFQYMDSTTENYDGVHDGYYYLDARLNAASYNQSKQRFYLYDYLERTSDSDKDKGVGQYSDILPFNSPYLFDADQLDEYVDSVLRPGYEYDAKDGEYDFQEYNSVDDATTNYFFGIRTDIEFFLPNDAGSTDEYGNYGNISTRGEHMIFDFHGDDDVWVLIDGELVLDIGGLHGVMFGQIDFSSGTVITGKDGGTTTTKSFTEILGHNITEGTHTMTVYYMERGSSQSNCAIYFNIAPRYDLEITKEDIVSAEKLDGAVFTIYNDEAMTSPAQLWDSEEAYNEDMKDGTVHNSKSSFTVVDGIAKCWGISAGKTYYIYEKTPPPGYPESDDMIRITLNNRGTATIETTTLHGANGVATEGFAVIKQNINETLKIVALTVTNQKEGDHTEVRVEKTWAEGSVNLPQSITVYLTADGVPLGRRATLSEANGWSYTWTGLEKYRSEGVDEEIVYEVQEVLVSGYITTQGATEKVENYTDWIRVDQMSDSKTFLLVHNGQALTYDGSFGWMEPAQAEKDSSLSAQWKVTTDHDGFHLKNGLGYTLTYGSGGFYGIDNDAVALNQVFYYLNSRLVVHDHDVYYQFGSNGSVVSQDGLVFTLYQKEVMTGFLTEIINVPVEEEDQTYVEVTKAWKDGNEAHADQSVTVRLYADGSYTGRTVTLNAGNGWTGGFYNLPYYQGDGVTVVKYTVVEDEVLNYVPEYSEPVVLPGLITYQWQIAETLQADETYRFTSGNYSLAVNSENDVTAAPNDPEDTNQQWKVVSRSGGLILQNVGSSRYLRLSSGDLTTTGNVSNATAVTLSGGRIQMGSSYLEIGAGYAQVTGSYANATELRVTRFAEIQGMSGTGYTVTNLPATYELPNTGSIGTSTLTFGGLLMIAGALMYIANSGRKRQKGGRQV